MFILMIYATIFFYFSDNLQDMPVLDLPPILEDFDLTLDDSFDD